MIEQETAAIKSKKAQQQHREQGSIFRTLQIEHLGNRIQAKAKVNGITNSNYEVHLNDNQVRLFLIDSKKGIYKEKFTIPNLGNAWIVSDFVKDGVLHIEIVQALSKWPEMAKTSEQKLKNSQTSKSVQL
ncbi:MAG: hypothetical protein R2813_12325 [Flavobacteriales bacterium]